ncbi:hypothetical protein ACHQM5_026600 [Ranunculus cassubicifolius]
MQKAPISRLHSSVQNQPNGQIKDVREPGGERLNSKVPVVGLNSKPQSKLPPEGTSSNPPQHLDRQKKRPFSSLDDEHVYFAELKKILSGPYKPFSNDDTESSGDELGEIDEETEAKMVEDEIARSIEEMRKQRFKRSS